MMHPVTKQTTVVKTDLTILLREYREAGLNEYDAWDSVSGVVAEFFIENGSWLGVPSRIQNLVSHLSPYWPKKDEPL